MSPTLGPLSSAVSRLRAWPVESQQRARRNAMVASTALAARKAEREDVERYLASVRPVGPVGPVGTARPAVAVAVER